MINCIQKVQGDTKRLKWVDVEDDIIRLDVQNICSFEKISRFF